MSTDAPQGFNPWPYSIIGFFALAILAAVVWVGFCLGHSTDLVAEDYYEQEVEYQTQLDRLERARDLSGRASVSYASGDACIQIQLPPEHAVPSPVGMIQLYRPSQAGLDQTLPLRVTAAGGQQLEVRELLPGRWDVRVKWSAGGREYFLNEKIFITRSDS